MYLFPDSVSITGALEDDDQSEKSDKSEKPEKPDKDEKEKGACAARKSRDEPRPVSRA